MNKRPKVRGVAYSGGKMALPGWKHPVVVDLAGMEIPESVPLLTNHGNQAVPQPVLEGIFEQVLPSAQRLLDTDAPETVEVVLRRQGDRQIVHLVNMASGERKVYRSGTSSYPFLKSLPRVRECRVSIRRSERPASVRFQPEDMPQKMP